jgi:uncharacterized surface protein with fasciclin (FAS1) repeats
MFRQFAATVVASLVAATSLVAQPQHSTSDIVDTAIAAGSFTTLVKALQAADLVETLKGKGPFTVLAPTDEAFAKLPAATLQDLLKPGSKEKLRRILTAHVIAGRVTAAEVVTMKSAKAVSGDSLKIMAGEGAVMIDDARVVKTDIAASNGIIHVIDTVIIPSDGK